MTEGQENQTTNEHEFTFGARRAVSSTVSWVVANMTDYAGFGPADCLEDVRHHWLKCFISAVDGMKRNNAQVDSFNVLLVNEIAIQRNENIKFSVSASVHVDSMPYQRMQCGV